MTLLFKPELSVYAELASLAVVSETTNEETERKALKNYC